MERMKSIKDQLISQVETQMSDLRCVDTKELGEVIDMIYDLSKSIYYCTVVKAMEEAKEDGDEKRTYYYMEKYLPYYPSGDRSSDYSHGQMYYDDTHSMTRDYKEGKSGMKRRMYMESKEMNHDQPKKIQELDEYLKELTNDITEMISGASPEEKTLLQRKLNTLVSKIQNV